MPATPGRHAIEFSVSDGEATDTMTVTIQVQNTQLTLPGGGQFRGWLFRWRPKVNNNAARLGMGADLGRTNSLQTKSPSPLSGGD